MPAVATWAVDQPPQPRRAVDANEHDSVPKCKVALKRQGLFALTCRCSHEFRWTCRAWNKSGHSYYNCPAYKKSTEGAKMDKVQKSANRQLGKCRFYKKLVEQSEKDIKEIEAFRQKKENEIGTLKLSLRDYDYVIQAADALIAESLVNMQIIASSSQRRRRGKGDAKMVPSAVKTATGGPGWLQCEETTLRASVGKW